MRQSILQANFPNKFYQRVLSGAASRKEKSKSELQQLDKNFYNAFGSYIKEKKAIIESLRKGKYILKNRN